VGPGKGTWQIKEKEELNGQYWIVKKKGLKNGGPHDKNPPGKESIPKLYFELDFVARNFSW